MLFLLLPIYSFSQNDVTRIEKDTLFTTCGFKIKAGSDIKLGIGSLPNGDFKYVSISAASWANIMDHSMSKEGIGRRYNGHLLHVKKFRTDGNKKRGFVYYLVVGGGNLANYDIDIESAIASGEVEIPDQFKVKPNASQTGSPSAADELYKLKDLFDSKALTQEEYDSAKKKILAKY